MTSTAASIPVSCEKSPTRANAATAEWRRASLFLRLLGLASVWHHTSSSSLIAKQWHQFLPFETPASIVICILGVLLAIVPTPLVALALSAVVVVDMAVRMPWIADHHLMTGLLMAGMLCVALAQVVKRRTLRIDPERWFADVAPLGRVLLVVMYFFGTFHKINTQFLDPQSSCAVAMFRALPIPSVIADAAWAQHAAIWGTLVLEGLAMCLLFTARWKYFGMVLGLSFHFAIGISGYGTIAHFSSLAFALHLLFIPVDAVARFADRWPALTRRATSLWALAAVGGGLLTAFAGLFEHWWLLRAVWAVQGSLVLAFVLVYGYSRQPLPRNYFVSRSPATNLLGLLFLVNCTGPYLGFSNVASIAMFSGLDTFAGRSNHLLMPPATWAPFMQDVAVIDGTNDTYLMSMQENGYDITLFELMRHVRQSGGEGALLFTLHGAQRFVPHMGSDPALSPEFRSPLHKLIAFRPVDRAPRPYCTH